MQCTKFMHGNLKVLSWIKRKIVIFWVKSRFIRQSHSQQIHSQQVRHLYGLLVLQWHQEILNLSLLFWQCFSRSFEGQSPQKDVVIWFIYQNIWKFVNLYFALRLHVWYQEILNLSLLFWKCFSRSFEGQSPQKDVVIRFIHQNIWKFVNVYFALPFHI